MPEVRFFDAADDSLFLYAIIVARYRGQWVFCKHRERTTYECPGGHREPGEAIGDTAGRELWEETGAVEYLLEPVCPYSVSDGGAETFGMLYYAEIGRFGPLPAFEIGKVELFDGAPDAWTYPEIQPKLVAEVKKRYALP